jgi:hypothetical protein
MLFYGSAEEGLAWLEGLEGLAANPWAAEPERGDEDEPDDDTT